MVEACHLFGCREGSLGVSRCGWLAAALFKWDFPTVHEEGQEG